MLPGGDHRFCVRHLYANYRDSGHKGFALKDKLWVAAAAYTEADFYKEIDELKNISEYAYNYLMNIDWGSWCRAWFNTSPKCDLLVNNLYECFNAYILNARDLPIISMLEMIRKKLMRRYQVKFYSIARNLNCRPSKNLTIWTPTIFADSPQCKSGKGLSLQISNMVKIAS